MGNCYCKQDKDIPIQTQMDVYVTAGKKEEDSKKEQIIKIDTNNLSQILNDNKRYRKSFFRKIIDTEETTLNKDKNNNNNIPKKNNIQIQRHAKDRVFQSVKVPKEIVKIDNQKLNIKINVDLCEDNKEKESILNFNSINDSEISPSNIKDENFFKRQERKFVRRSLKSTTGIDKSMINKKLLSLEMSIPIQSDKLVIQQKGEIKDNYEIGKRLGSGPMGTVYKAKNIHLKHTVAVKMIKRVMGKDDQKEESYIKKEIYMLKKLIHPNVVQIHEFYSDIKYYQLVMEYCKKGELSQYIKKSFSEKQLAIIFYQILSGLCYLHDNGIIHKDIKLNNIMIKGIEEDINTKEEYFWIKLADFHTTDIFQKNFKNSKNVKNKYYNSPEALNNEHTKESDLWSVGVLLHILLSGKVPFDGNTDEDINNKIKNESYNDLEPRLLARSQEVRDLLNKLLEKDKNKRITAEVALKHGWFIKYKGRELFSNFSPDDIQQYINNLCIYSCESKISQLVLAFIVHNMPESLSILTILKLFRYFNLSGNCKLTKAELRKGLYNYRNEEQIDNIVDQLFLVLDGDNNGYIEFEEFLRACVDKKKVLTKDNIWHAFKFLDDNNTNSIDVQTLMRAFNTRPNKMLEAVFNKTLNNVQLDSNGKITFNEFEQIILNSLKE